MLSARYFQEPSCGPPGVQDDLLPFVCNGMTDTGRLLRELPHSGNRSFSRTRHHVSPLTGTPYSGLPEAILQVSLVFRTPSLVIAAFRIPFPEAVAECLVCRYHRFVSNNGVLGKVCFQRPVSSWYGITTSATTCLSGTERLTDLPLQHENWITNFQTPPFVWT